MPADTDKRRTEALVSSVWLDGFDAATQVLRDIAESEELPAKQRQFAAFFVGVLAATRPKRGQL